MRSFVVALTLSLAALSARAQPNLDDIQAWAEAKCTRIFDCMPGASLHRQFGDDVADCVERNVGYKERTMLAPGAVTDTSLPACAEAMLAASCDEYIDMFFVDAESIPECWASPPGTRLFGEGCAYGAQCTSLFCQSFEGSCGFCDVLPGVGQPCDFTFGCDALAGLTCDFNSGTCVDGKRRGETCGFGEPCFGSLLCVGGTCQPFDLAGAPCDPNGATCAFVTDGLICNNQTNQCEPGTTTAGTGANCGLGGPTGGLDYCADGLCDMTVPTTINPASGTCIAASAAPLGEACAYAGFGFDGPACLDFDARCEGGVCVVDDPEACPDVPVGEGEGEGGEGEGEGGEGEGEGGVGPTACSCAADCDDGEACGGGFCVPACAASGAQCADENANACVLDNAGGGACVPRNAELLAPTGAICSASRECISGTCLLAFGLGRSVCGAACEADADCPEDGACGEDGVCLAKAAVCAESPGDDLIEGCSCSGSSSSRGAPVGVAAVALLALCFVRNLRSAKRGHHVSRGSR